MRDGSGLDYDRDTNDIFLSFKMGNIIAFDLAVASYGDVNCHIRL
jgi:hypothetical protein